PRHPHPHLPRMRCDSAPSPCSEGEGGVRALSLDPLLSLLAQRPRQLRAHAPPNSEPRLSSRALTTARAPRSTLDSAPRPLTSLLFPHATSLPSRPLVHPRAHHHPTGRDHRFAVDLSGLVQ